MYVLFNGSPTKDFKVTRCLRQGDPLPHFLLVEEGFSSLLHQAVSSRNFVGFHFNTNYHFDLLEFADDTIMIGEGTWNNLWTIKNFLREFYLVLGLRVNLTKRKLFGINLDSYFCKRPLLFCLMGFVCFSLCFLVSQ